MVRRRRRSGEEEPRGLSGSRAPVCAGEEFRQGTGGSRFGGSLTQEALPGARVSSGTLWSWLRSHRGLHFLRGR